MQNAGAAQKIVVQPEHRDVEPITRPLVEIPAALNPAAAVELQAQEGQEHFEGFPEVVADSLVLAESLLHALREVWGVRVEHGLFHSRKHPLDVIVLRL